jgi:PTS system cellobiose-specific IIB component
MLNIKLFCSFGASSSIFMAKMKQYIEENQLKIEISANSQTDIERIIREGGFDGIILAPSLAYRKATVEKAVGGEKFVETISVADYGKMDGAKVLKEIIDKYSLEEKVK